MLQENGISGVERIGILKVVGGKLIRVRLFVEDDKIASIRFTGDFFLYPEEDIDVLEKELVGTPLEDNILLNRLSSFFQSRELVGASPEDFMNLIVESR